MLLHLNPNQPALSLRGAKCNSQQPSVAVGQGEEYPEATQKEASNPGEPTYVPPSMCFD